MVSPNSTTYNEYCIWDNLYLKIKYNLKTQKININYNNIVKELNGIHDVFDYLDNDIMPMRVRSVATWKELGQAPISSKLRTVQGRRIQQLYQPRSLNLYCTGRKAKIYQRYKVIWRFYANNQMIKEQLYWYKVAEKYHELKKEIRIISMDCASVKKIGTRESNNDARNTRKVVLTEMFRSGNV